MDFEFDSKDILYVRIDRKKKFPATVLLRALGYTTSELLKEFYDKEEILVEPPIADELDIVWWKDKIARATYTLEVEREVRQRRRRRAEKDKSSEDSKQDGSSEGPKVEKFTEVICKEGEPLTDKFNDWSILKLFEKGVRPLPVNESFLKFAVALTDLYDQDGEIWVKAGTRITQKVLEDLLTNESIQYLQGKIRPPYNYYKKFDKKLILGQKALRDVFLPNGELLVKKNKSFGRRETSRNIRKLIEHNIEKIPIYRENLIKKVVAEDIYHPVDGDVLALSNEELTDEILQEIEERGIRSFQILFIDDINVRPYFLNTLNQDGVKTPEEALQKIYEKMKPGEPFTLEAATTYFNNLFFNPDRYNLSRVGRLKLNHKFNLDIPLDKTTLTPQDIINTVKYLINLRNGQDGYKVDDIDHLGNRRVKTVGELVERQFRVGLARLERSTRDKMNSNQGYDEQMPHDLINHKTVSSTIREFFGSSQLSQFMDQTNPLSEITHKRRLSALGPGGLSRERAGYEVRDVHATHYGRICPIETPEGPNIGLISSLASYARINEFGFIETPYRKVVDSRVTDEVVYCSALEEEKYHIAQANEKVDETGRFVNKFVTVRKAGGDIVSVRREEVDLIDLSPSQLVSIATSLIPFLEHDDANRALMGSNMQRQAVPLLKTSAPLVGTGVERIVAKDCGMAVVAKRDGVVESVDASRIVVRVDKDQAENPLGTQVDIYNLIKFKRSNQDTCINQKPLVNPGDRVRKGDIIADGPAIECGELALGQNVIVAFMPWGGYNFEDAILLSERLVKEDVYTSIHIEKFDCQARDTKLGPEEITRDIPNTSEEALKNLDESGIVRIGAEVKPNDILVGKITPKTETQLSPEEKLLRAIFGEKATDVKDTSKKVPPGGVTGIVIDTQVFSRRKGEDSDPRLQELRKMEEEKFKRDRDIELKILKKALLEKFKEILVGQVTARRLLDKTGNVLIEKGVKITEEILDKIPEAYWSDIELENSEAQEELRNIRSFFSRQYKMITKNYEEKIKRLSRDDDLPPGTNKMVKVYVAIKRKIQVGDKMAGRHGNKGVVSRILPEEDMPYLPDGTPVDIVLNPLGVPSRMNVGQILETHLGWALRKLGEKFKKMVEEKFSDETIRAELKKLYPEGSTVEYLGEKRELWKLIDQLSGEDLREFCKKLSNGVHVRNPVFDSASEKDIRYLLEQAGEDPSGQSVLFDGRTGEVFASNVTVGVMYMMKLHHLVDDKIHARSTGPYSLVTQQPLGGKAQFGGQRLGEMEVWAMEAYGAAYGLQEFLTVKSDDMEGRNRMYESIVKGTNVLKPGIPESFNVLIKELQSLALDVELLEDVEDPYP